MSYMFHIQEHGKALGSKDNSLLKRWIENEDPIENNAQVVNMPTLSESSVIEELIVSKETQVLEEIITFEEFPNETVTLKELWKYKNEKKSINYTYIREIWMVMI